MNARVSVSVITSEPARYDQDRERIIRDLPAYPVRSIRQASWWTTPSCDVTNGRVYKVLADEPQTWPLESRDDDGFSSNVV